MADIVLVNPPYPEAYGKLKEIYTAPPLGLLYVASVLEEDGFTVRVLDPTSSGMGFNDYISARAQIISGF